MTALVIEPDSVLHEVERAARITQSVLRSDAARRDIARACAVVDRLGDELDAACAHMGLGSVTAWRVVEVRDALASHVFAARAMDGVCSSQTQVAVLRRGVDRVVDAVQRLRDPIASG